MDTTRHEVSLRNSRKGFGGDKIHSRFQAASSLGGYVPPICNSLLIQTPLCASSLSWHSTLGGRSRVKKSRIKWRICAVGRDDLRPSGQINPIRAYTKLAKSTGTLQPPALAQEQNLSFGVVVVLRDYTTECILLVPPTAPHGCRGPHRLVEGWAVLLGFVHG